MTTINSSSSRSFAQRFSPPSSTTHAGPLPFAPTLESRPASATSSFQPSSRVITPLAAPPPPLNLAPNPASTNMGRKIPYAGAEHTLGPTFSEEEDGDDSAWIASKMAVLGLDPQGVPYNGQYAAKDNARRDQSRARSHAQGSYDTTRSHQPTTRSQRYQQQMAQQQQLIQQQMQSSDQMHSIQPHLSAQHQQLQYMEQLQQRQFAQLQAQQQQLAHLHIMAQQPGQSGQPYREALATLQIQAQQAPQSQSSYQSQLANQQAHTQRAVLEAQLRQAQPYAYHEQPQKTTPHSAIEQRSALAAQVQANLLARANRSRNGPVDEQDVRARFESAPNTSHSYTTPQTTSKPVFEPIRSPFGDWRSSTQNTPITSAPARPTPTQANRFTTSQGDSLSTFLARRRATDESSLSSESEFTSLSTEMTPNHSKADTAQTSPNPSLYNDERAKAQAVLGMGRPSTVNSKDRASTVPITTIGNTAASATPRSASFGGISARTFVIRQPLGPPGEAKDLGDKNFASRIRKQAAVNLGLLGRRVETPLSTPNLI